jgi:O-antigen/teichoic acid export membrane protein
MTEVRPQNSSDLARNVVYGWLTWFGPMILSLAATPIIVDRLGLYDYGIYALALGVIGYSFSFGVGRTITKFVAEYRLAGETEKIREVVSATLVLGGILGVGGALVLILSANWIVADVLLIDSHGAEKAISAIYIAAGIIFVTITNQALASILQGLHRFDLFSKLFNLQSLVLVAGNLLLVLLGFGLLGLLAWNLITVTGSTVLFAVTARRLLPELGLTLAVPMGTIKLVLAFSGSLIGYQVVTNAILLFERGWITRRMGSDELSYYVVAMTLGIYVQAFTASLVMALFPLSSELTGQTEKLQGLYQKATKFIVCITVFLMVLIVVGSREFLSLWMGSDFAEAATDLLIVHTITFSAAAILSVSWQFKEGLGVPKFNFIVSAIGMAVAIPSMIYLSRDLGSLWVAIGRLAGFLLMLGSIVHFERWLFGAAEFRFWARILSMFGVAAIAAGAVEWFLLKNLPMGWPYFIFAAGVAGLLYLVILYLSGFLAEDEKAMFKRIIKRA